MVITVEGEFSLDPFDRQDRGDPIGQMIGTGTVVGDGSGGLATLTWSTPQNFGYIMLGASAFSTGVSDQAHFYRFLTGYQVNGINERWAVNILGVTINNSQQTTFTPPKVMTLPGSIVPSLTISFVNVLGGVFLATWRALVFDRDAVIATPSRMWREWVK